MPTFDNIVINDGAASPVAHTFKPRREDGGVFKWQDVALGVALGFPTLTASIREPINKPNGKRVYRVTMKLNLPVLDPAVAGEPPEKALDLGFIGEFLIPEDALAAHRSDLHAYVYNALNHATVKALVKDLESVF